MADTSQDPLVGYKFALELQGKLSGFFTNVSGIGSETEVIREKVIGPNGEAIEKAIPGRTTWTPITMKRGVTDNMDVWNWRKEVTDGKVESARCNASIIAFNQENQEVARWNLERCWPSKVTGPEMDAASTNYLVEDITIVHEGMDRVS